MQNDGGSTREMQDTVRASEPSEDGWPRFMVRRMIGEIAICPKCTGDIEQFDYTEDDEEDDTLVLRCASCGHVR